MIKRRFTHVPTAILDDARLDWKDIGLLAYLLSLPSSADSGVQELIKAKRSGRDAVYNSLKRLREAGYLTYQRFSDGSTTWFVSETPSRNPSNAEERHV